MALILKRQKKCSGQKKSKKKGDDILEKKMLSKMPEDKLKELEKFLRKQIGMEIIYGQELQEKSDKLLKKGG